MSAITIRPATSTDCPVIAVLHQEALHSLADLAPSGFGDGLRELPETASLISEFSAASTDENADLLVADLHGSLCGFVLAAVEEHGDDLLAPPFLTIQYLAVTRDLRGQGIGRQLLEAVEKAAGKRGINMIDALVWESNPAVRKLNEQLGFTTLERRMVKRLS